MTSSAKKMSNENMVWIRSRQLVTQVEAMMLDHIEALEAERAEIIKEARRECADWVLNWCDRTGIKVEESTIRQGLQPAEEEAK